MSGLSTPHCTTERHYSALSPYLIPRALSHKKRVNYGDGIILRAIERHIGRLRPECVVSPRLALTSEEINRLADTDGVILAGANQLNDRYTLWPGLTPEHLRDLPVRFIPFGIGIHGEAGHNEGLSDQSKEILSIVHERIPFSSWRCPTTVDYLRRELPHLSEKLLMTGCPVLYDRPLLEGRPFSPHLNHIAVTVTERGDFLERERALLTHVARSYPKAQRLLVLHQNFFPPSRFERLRHAAGRRPSHSVELLRFEARRLGYRVFIPQNADHLIKLYHSVDAHVGSRLHAHLLCLSLAKRSALIGIDQRSTGIADYFGFSLHNADTACSGLDADFEIVRERARAGFLVMQQFIKAVFNQ